MRGPMQDLGAGTSEERCYDVILLSQPCYDLMMKMFQQNKYININKTANY